ncbi:MAG: hypothetical protein A2Y28_02535 [Chlamydiae bacterium GWC2_50_10]|nr:MAG: hypothetical protein A2Y28_02535 [Chlamydiae bacterium GWC2_50_10]OGN55301.1 MAG: hypothetical protein A2098_03070 [Chlamydiae bacterium GWF2_49_8]OGN57978.1 MAG: hypothetical protein A3D18_05495 [Chlamydiae bacterium RIFCSPHIGHO2_02_FULL_49_29]OGN63194.1 MAG: hypothetical protein A3E26_06410 [Chlamydiae bacterium RIFCSPHIGHO2_12_FULL_49_32]OGN67614.1 MAG: hypothetical protein A3I15_02820 [Chlamydiae bacterium RIFCSPLOWO2_02_FULL_49_12]OGN70935.1 MAG: hypothetical protein A3G30_06285 [
MLKTLLTLLLFVPASLLYSAPERQKKIYLDPSGIRLGEKEIFVQIDDEWVSVAALYADGKGLYTLPASFYLPWKCKICHTLNEGWCAVCQTADCPGKRPPKFSLPKPPFPFLPPEELPLLFQ